MEAKEDGTLPQGGTMHSKNKKSTVKKNEQPARVVPTTTQAQRACMSPHSHPLPSAAPILEAHLPACDLGKMDGFRNGVLGYSKSI